MGAYTQFRFKVKLKSMPEFLDQIINDDDFYEDLYKTYNDKEVMGTLISEKESPSLPISHEFGQCRRWYQLFHGNNWNVKNNPGSKLEKGVLTIETEFKNYDDEIDLFKDWIKPHVKEIIQDEEIFVG